MKDRRSTRIKCILLTLVLTVLSAFFAYRGHPLANTVIAIIAGALIINFAFKASTKDRVRLKEMVAKCDHLLSEIAHHKETLHALIKKTRTILESKQRKEKDVQALLDELQTLLKKEAEKKHARHSIN